MASASNAKAPNGRANTPPCHGPCSAPFVADLLARSDYAHLKIMTRYIDDISSVAAILLLACAIAAALFRRTFPPIVRLLSAVALGTAATITLLFALFVVAIATSSPPRLARYDAVSTVCAVFTFLPPQLLWLPAIHRRVFAVALIACLTFVPTLLSIGLLRSSAQPFYFPHL